MTTQTHALAICKNSCICFLLLFSKLCAAEDIAAKDRDKPDQHRLLLTESMLESDSLTIVGSPQIVEFSSPLCETPQLPGIAAISPSRLMINANEFVPQWVRLDIAAAGASCAKKKRSINLFILKGGLGGIRDGSLTFWFDSGVMEFLSSDMQGYQIVPIIGETAEEPCACLQQTNCTCNLSEEFRKELSAGSPKTSILLLPAAIPISRGKPLPMFVSAQGMLLDRSVTAINPKRIIFNRSFIEVAKLDAEKPRHEISVRFPGAIDQVTCDAAECRVTKDGIMIFEIDSAASLVNVRYTLKPQYFRSLNDKLLTSESVKLKVERCNIKIPDNVPLLSGVENHRYFIQVPRNCITQEVTDLQLDTHPPSQAYVRGEIALEDPNTSMLEIFFERVPSGADAVTVNLFESVGSPRLVGSIQIPVTSNYRPSFVRMNIDNLGPIDFIPSNRSARLFIGYPTPERAKNIHIEERAGFYSISKGKDSKSIRGNSGISGNIPLLFAYRPTDLIKFFEKPETEEAPVLTMFYSEALFPIRGVNVPLPLVGDKKRVVSFVSVMCGRDDHEKHIEVGELAHIDFAARDTCRIVFDCNKIPESAGVQRLHITAGDLNQIVSLIPKGGRLSLSIPTGERTEYDTLIVSVSHDLLSSHYTLFARQNVSEEAKYRILLTDSRLKISGTTALPTGMFRFGSSKVQGTVPISAGVLLRATYLKKNGREFPLGLEMGLFGTNLSGQPDFSMVTGIGFSIPVLNTNTVLQASLNIHGWLEYAPTRAN